jgi:hypothetical protein
MSRIGNPHGAKRTVQPIAWLSRLRVGTLLDCFLYIVGKRGPFHHKIDVNPAHFAACGRGQALSFGPIFATLGDEFFGGQIQEFRARKIVTQQCLLIPIKFYLSQRNLFAALETRYETKGQAIDYWDCRAASD